MESGIWVSTQMKMRIPKDIISSPTAFLPEYTVAGSFLQRVEPDNTNILILKTEFTIKLLFSDSQYCFFGFF